LGLSQLTRVMVVVGEKMGAEDSNGKATQMSADPHARWCGEGARQRASLPDLRLVFVVGFVI
jgi:hypothetical protein